MEHVAAIEAERARAAVRGIRLSETWREDNELRYSLGGVPAHQRDDVFVVYPGCRMKHVRNVATAWTMGSAPSTQYRRPAIGSPRALPVADG